MLGIGLRLSLHHRTIRAPGMTTLHSTSLTSLFWFLYFCVSFLLLAQPSFFWTITREMSKLSASIAFHFFFLHCSCRLNWLFITLYGRNALFFLGTIWSKMSLLTTNEASIFSVILSVLACLLVNSLLTGTLGG